MSVLYITQNGITDHIGRSQVAPYVIGLAKMGFVIHVLSAEKIGQQNLIELYQREFEQVGVRWTRVLYRNRPPLLGQLLTQTLMKRAARQIIANEHIRIVHCRSFPPTLIAHRLKRTTGIKYIFDFRDFYADGGLTKTTGLTRLAFKRLKELEGPMITAADKVVCLTQRATELLSEWYFKDDEDASRRFSVIPCCADFEHFNLARVTESQRGSAYSKAGIPPGSFVLLYLGSLGPDYLLPQMMALFRQVVILRPDAHFLFVSNNGRDLVAAECRQQNITPDRIHFVSADRSEIPSLLALANLSVVFIRADVSKAGCSPTKLAELFACNVPVIANSGVGDMDKIVDIERNGSVIVEDFSDETLRDAVAQVLRCTRTDINWIRAHSHQFSLATGVECYANVYRELLNH